MAHTVRIETADLPLAAAAAMVIYVAEDSAPAGGAAAIWAATGLDWARIAEVAKFRGKQGQMLDVLAPAGLEAQRLVVLGSGKPDATPSVWTDRGGSLAAKLMGLKVESAAVLLDEAAATPAGIAELAAGFRLRHYRFDRYKRPRDDNGEPAEFRLTLHVADEVATDRAIADRMAVAEGTLLARDLVHEPPNLLGTLEVASRAEALRELGVEVEILDAAAMQALGMNALLAVAQGSERPARLAIMQWRGGGGAAPVAIVGKGVVFDSGGISIKPGAGMEDMKGDMAGAATVIGLMHALASRKAKVNVVGVIGLVENMPSGTAMRPGDILTAMSGTTIEVVNTDAEGRLVLADALWYTEGRFKPKAIVDLATLTGAIVVALGHEHAGLFSNNDALAADLLAAGPATGEKLWRMPLGAAYDKLIDSRFADIKNSGGRPAGSITAAQFLKRFIKDTPWAHLDIASTALGSPTTETNAAWSSGYGVALLDRWLRDKHEAK